MLVLEQTSLNILCWCYASDDIYINQPISVIIRRKWGKKHFNFHFHVNFRVIEMAVKKEKGELISIEGFSLIRFFFQNIRKHLSTKTFLHHLPKFLSHSKNFQVLHFYSMFTSKTQTPASSFGYPIHHYTWQQYY